MINLFFIFFSVHAMAVFIFGRVHAALPACSTCVAWPCEECCPHRKSMHCLFLNACKNTWPTGASSPGGTQQHTVKSIRQSLHENWKEGFFGDKKRCRGKLCSSVNRPHSVFNGVPVSFLSVIRLLAHSLSGVFSPSPPPPFSWH